MNINLRSTLKSLKLQEFHQPFQGKLLLIFYLYFGCWCFHKDNVFRFELMLPPQSFLLELLVLPQDDDEQLVIVSFFFDEQNSMSI
jgi:hypothetical protein